ncbi:ATP-binding cassette domain-containing protein [Saccharibacter sp. 17.LH.SD]|uniref:ABC transporter ATP-binding protein n=1 Tax=Saccharibacter sp. 17.LH.SD TaxID=2689393 RepID=UPI00136C47F2|nr:ABC transporter ATP-binding protein [Saccharibacter sp. 17.LH.SD]MXV44592.1 ATP-binding cassette domain-containing protein [Saccharibacter sp. 17.LH.SD]
MSDMTTSSSSSPHALKLHHVARSFRSGDKTLEVLKDVHFSLECEEMVALVAPSGTGKSTLLHIAGLLELPDSGDVIVNGRVTRTLGEKGRTAVRRDEIGFVYQFHHLLGEFTACENVMLPQMVAGQSRYEARKRAEDLLGRFGLQTKLDSLPGQMSGGEQQRTAIARALANNPSLLLADEPTGNLDVKTAEIVFQELTRVVREEGTAVLVATHNEDLAAATDRIMTLQEGAMIPFS